MQMDMRYADYILEEIDRANKVISNFLTLAKPKIEDWWPVNVNELLLSMLELMENQALLRGVVLTWNLQPEPPSVLSKPEALKQVFLNMLSNALQATATGGRVRVATMVSDGWLQVIIEDTGVGMSSVQLERIFDPFYSTKAEGTGLGLSLCRQIVEEHGGQIKVESVLGEGSRFTVCLPAQ